MAETVAVDEVPTCPICMGDYDSDTDCYNWSNGGMPCCRKSVHLECLFTWRFEEHMVNENHLLCPMCRAYIPPVWFFRKVYEEVYKYASFHSFLLSADYVNDEGVKDTLNKMSTILAPTFFVPNAKGVNENEDVYMERAYTKLSFMLETLSRQEMHAFSEETFEDNHEAALMGKFKDIPPYEYEGEWLKYVAPNTIDITQCLSNDDDDEGDNNVSPSLLSGVTSFNFIEDDEDTVVFVPPEVDDNDDSESLPDLTVPPRSNNITFDTISGISSSLYDVNDDDDDDTMSLPDLNMPSASTSSAPTSSAPTSTSLNINVNLCFNVDSDSDDEEVIPSSSSVNQPSTSSGSSSSSSSNSRKRPRYGRDEDRMSNISSESKRLCVDVKRYMCRLDNIDEEYNEIANRYLAELSALRERRQETENKLGDCISRGNLFHTTVNDVIGKSLCSKKLKVKRKYASKWSANKQLIGSCLIKSASNNARLDDEIAHVHSSLLNGFDTDPSEADQISSLPNL